MNRRWRQQGTQQGKKTQPFSVIDASCIWRLAAFLPSCAPCSYSWDKIMWGISDSSVCYSVCQGFKGIVQPKLKFHPVTPSRDVDGRVWWHFSNPHDHSGVSQRETITTNANTVKAYRSLVLQCKISGREKHNMSPYSTVWRHMHCSLLDRSRVSWVWQDSLHATENSHTCEG